MFISLITLIIKMNSKYFKFFSYKVFSLQDLRNCIKNAVLKQVLRARSFKSYQVVSKFLLAKGIVGLLFKFMLMCLLLLTRETNIVLLWFFYYFNICLVLKACILHFILLIYKNKFIEEVKPHIMSIGRP